MASDIEKVRADAIKASARIIKCMLELEGTWISEDKALEVARKSYIAHEMALWRDISELDEEEIIGPEPKKGWRAKRQWRKQKEMLPFAIGDWRPRHHTLEELDTLHKDWFFQ